MFYNILHYFNINYVLAECDPLSLQELCRGKIRRLLRQNIWHEHSDLEEEKPILPPQQRNAQQRALGHFVIPIFEESDDALTDDEQELIAGRTRFLVNVDTHPGEAITTTLQLVRAVIQPNQNENQENRQDANNDESTRQDVEDMDSDECEQKRKSTPKNSVLNTSENSMGHSSNVTTEQIDSNSKKEENVKKSTIGIYSNMSESDSDTEQENIFMQRKKIAKREKTDSGIVEDLNLSNEEGSSSSNSNHSDSENTDGTEIMDVDLSDIEINRSISSVHNSHLKDSCSRGDISIAHYLNSHAFANYMVEKIQQLPLPSSMKLYLNYNRTL